MRGVRNAKRRQKLGAQTEKLAGEAESSQPAFSF
jgi:hypothetical protein